MKANIIISIWRKDFKSDCFQLRHGLHICELQNPECPLIIILNIALKVLKEVFRICFEVICHRKKDLTGIYWH